MTSKNPSCYQILEIEKTATPEEIKIAYRKLSLKWHPDKFGQPGHLAKTREEAEEKTKQINNAYEVLSNPEKKKRHDDFINKFTFTDKVIFFSLIAILAGLVLAPENGEKSKN